MPTIPAGDGGAAPAALITLADAKQQLDKKGTVDDNELQVFIDAVNQWVDDTCGPVIPRSVTSTVTAKRGQLWLPTPPVLAVTGVASAGASPAAGSWSAEPYGLVAGRFYGTYVVTYTAGRAPVPATLRLAARILLQHMWETQRGAADLPLDTDLGRGPGFGFAVPNRVRELVSAYVRPPAFG